MNNERMIAVSSDLIERAISLLNLLPESGTIIELRAALATQPAEVDAFTNALEVMEGFTGENWTEIVERFPLLAEQVEGYASRKVAEASGICQRPAEGWACSRKPGHDGPCAASVSAPPAAAHEDEAARKDAERYRWLRACGDEWGNLRFLVSRGDVDAEALDEAVDAAMRAKGDGEPS